VENNKNVRILVVDDEEPVLHLVELLLRRVGYTPILAHNAKEAADILKQKPLPDLMILDLMMPGISGIELCRALRAHEATRGTPVIMLSSLNDPQTINNCLNAGATAFVCKSDMQRLPAIVRKFLPAPTPGPLSRQEAQAGIDAK